MRGVLCRQFMMMSAVLMMSSVMMSSAAKAAEFTIVNASETPLQHLYVSPCGAKQWGHDQFAEALPPSRYFTVSNITPGCYDVEFVVDPWNVCVLAGATLHRRAVWKVTHWTVFGSQGGECSHVVGYVSAGQRPWIW